MRNSHDNPGHQEVLQRKMRTLLSEPDKETMNDIETLPYRAVWPKGFLLPYPVDTQIIPNLQEYGIDSELRSERIVPIVRNQLSPYTPDHACLFCWRASRDITKEDIPKSLITLLIRTDMAKIPLDTIERTILDVRKVLAEDESTSSILVEVTDYHVENNLFTFPIGTNNDKVAEDMETACLAVIQIINGHEWLAVEGVRRGYRDDPNLCDPTVAITTPTAHDPKWMTNIVPAIAQRISNLRTHIGIEILCETSIH